MFYILGNRHVYTYSVHHCTVYTTVQCTSLYSLHSLRGFRSSSIRASTLIFLEHDYCHK